MERPTICTMHISKCKYRHLNKRIWKALHTESLSLCNLVYAMFFAYFLEGIGCYTTGVSSEIFPRGWSNQIRDHDNPNLLILIQNFAKKQHTNKFGTKGWS